MPSILRILRIHYNLLNNHLSQFNININILKQRNSTCATELIERKQSHIKQTRM